jgi:hypothetical protein
MNSAGKQIAKTACGAKDSWDVVEGGIGDGWGQWHALDTRKKGYDNVRDMRAGKGENKVLTTGRGVTEVNRSFSEARVGPKGARSWMTTRRHHDLA